ncbi:hypothetical protein EJ04DRAFT_527481 [Polyplosphaeria fusca]|uniref:Uncharacterized protein n=1 Tax=Polyplosphaeria fusca TaxID=682080 RepID=A0A9P4QQL6_9PLEO|nr:hypothetical protein EJ04DRAFT_527481 [Polyplosphaeria fusca]
MASTAKTNVVEQAIVPDMRELDQNSRKALAEGPKVRIFRGKQPEAEPVTAYLSKRALMAFSRPVNEKFTKNPDCTELRLNPDLFSVKTIKHLCDYMNGLCRTKNAFTMNASSNLIDNIAIYRAGKMWGLDVYLSKLARSILGAVQDTEKLISYTALTMISNLDMKDPVFNCAAEVFADLRRKDLIPDREDFEEWLDSRTAFHLAMDRWHHWHVEKEENAEAYRARQQRAAEQAQREAHRAALDEYYSDWRNHPYWQRARGL